MDVVKIRREKIPLTLEKTIKALPDEAKRELSDFAEFLKKKYVKESGHKKLKLDWAGKLEKQGKKFDDVVQLQHEIAVQ